MLSPILRLLALLCVCEASRFSFQCPGNDKSAELSFAKPVGFEWLSNYPPTLWTKPSHRPTEMTCCATGFSHIVWYKDGVELGPTNNHTHRYSSNGTREKIIWYSLESDLKNISTITKFTCRIFAANSTSYIENTVVIDIRRLPTLDSRPWFTRAEAPACLYEGQDLVIHCRLQFPKDDHSFSRRTFLSFVNEYDETAIVLIPDDKLDYNYTVSENKTIFDLDVLFRNVSSEYLNKTYVCRSVSYKNVRSDSITVLPCEPEIAPTELFIVRREDPLSVAVAVPIAIGLIIAVVLLALAFKYHTYLYMWCRVKVIPIVKIQKSGDYKYHAYLIYSDVSHPAVAQTIELLNDKYKLDLCVPDRDFTVGCMTPESLSEGINSSEKVIVFLSNDMFTKDEKGDDWSDVSLSLSLALNKPTIIVLLEDIDTKVLKKHKDIQAALKVLGSTQYSSPTYEQKLMTVFRQHFKLTV